MSKDPHIGVYIRALRFKRNRTQEWLAKAVKCSRQTMQSWEAGATEPKYSMVVRMCKALDYEMFPPVL